MHMWEKDSCIKEDILVTFQLMIKVFKINGNSFISEINMTPNGRNHSVEF